MKKVCLLLLIIPMLMESNPASSQIKYPITKKVNDADFYFGTKVEDPYRWLENDTTAETAKWVDAQNKVTFSYLEKIPFRNQIKERLTKIWNYPKYSTPFFEGNRYFFFKNDGMQNQSVLYVREGIDGEPKVLIDPNTLSKDGTIALANYSPSKDAKYFAYGLSKGGSDWEEYFVIDLNTGKQLGDKLEWVKFSGIAWSGDGFYYSRYDAPKGSELSAKNENHKLYYHKIGTPQSQDILIFEDPKNPLRNVGAGTTEDERFLLLTQSESTSGNSLAVRDLQKNPLNNQSIGAKGFVTIISDFKNEYSVIDNIGDKLLVVTNDDAPRQRVVLIDPAKPAKANWKTIIPEQTEVLQGVYLIGGKIITVYMKDACSKAYIHNIDGVREKEFPLPGLGTVGGFSGKKDQNLCFYSFTSFTFPTTIFKTDISVEKSEILYKSDIDFKTDDYETKQVFYTSKDGTKIPMFIVHKKGIKLDGSNPCLLYGYGGFNVSLTPSFSLSRLILLENGGIYAMPNIRGGGEYGEEWHKAGTVLQKQNVFDDFIAAAEYLIREEYTSSQKLAIMGGSNGGLLVGACMTQRPTLFKVAIPQVGVMDMLRYHKFTIGWAWAGDYGTSADSTQFLYLHKYSPLHNIRTGMNYPATLVLTADRDDRVVPAHSFKFIATLQEKYKGTNPAIIRIEKMAGHSAGKPTAKVIEEMADIYSFIFFNLGMTPKY